MRATRVRRYLLLLACLLGSTPAVHAATEGTFTTEVPPGKWKAVRVRNLPVAAKIAVEAHSTGSVGIAFLDSTDYKNFPAAVAPLFQGRFEDRLSFSVTITTPGDYYALLDNRNGEEARRVVITIKGSRGGPVRASPASLEKLQASLDEFEQKLTSIFIFQPFPMKVTRCGMAQAFASAKGIVLCAEYAEKLYETLGEKEKVSDALLFTVFHELGHVLLAQWKSPVYDNEEVADEFATAVMILLGLKDRVKAKAEFFEAQPARLEALAKSFKDDRHPLSAQRARNILRWANDPTLLRKWQGQLLPHMRTAVLEKLEQAASPPFERSAIARELNTRRQG
ncbi:MAG: DUF4344 domain-containing metallopeptidase [Nitrospira sp.]|nr:DUF4344 domain-containing metallopeptidase [Nitrospira sp.]